MREVRKHNIVQCFYGFAVFSPLLFLGLGRPRARKTKEIKNSKSIANKHKITKTHEKQKAMLFLLLLFFKGVGKPRAA